RTQAVMAAKGAGSKVFGALARGGELAGRFRRVREGREVLETNTEPERHRTRGHHRHFPVRDHQAVLASPLLEGGEPARAERERARLEAREASGVAHPHRVLHLRDDALELFECEL